MDFLLQMFNSSFIMSKSYNYMQNGMFRDIPVYIVNKKKGGDKEHNLNEI